MLNKVLGSDAVIQMLHNPVNPVGTESGVGGAPMAAPQADKSSPLRRKIRPAMMQKRISLFISVTSLYEAFR